MNMDLLRFWSKYRWKNIGEIKSSWLSFIPPNAIKKKTLLQLYDAHMRSVIHFFLIYLVHSIAQPHNILLNAHLIVVRNKIALDLHFSCSLTLHKLNLKDVRHLHSH